VEHFRASHIKMGGEALEKVRTYRGVSRRAVHINSIQVIQDWGGDRKKITHFVWATATASHLMPTEGLLRLTKHGLSDNTMLIPMLNVGCCSSFRGLELWPMISFVPIQPNM
jgi:hypothetical protein